VLCHTSSLGYAPHPMGSCKEDTGDPQGIEDFLIARRTAIAATVGSRKPLFSDAVGAR
jgi:hypothetical protein